jgi:hypothetical protein
VANRFSNGPHRRRHAGIVKSSILIVLGLVLAAPTGSSARPSVPAVPSHKDVFESWGTDCASKVQHIRFWFEPGIIEKRQDVETGPNCELVAAPVQTTRTPIPSTTIPASVSGPPKWCPGLGGGFNWIHTSWTLQQNVSNSDMVWLRSSFFKLWTCSTTFWSDYFGDVYAWSGGGGGRTNNQPTWPFVDWDCSRQTFVCLQTIAETKANFTVKKFDPLVDTLPHNCPVSEQINVYSYRDGSWFVDFWTVGNCFPNHSSTAASVSDYESAGYGGKTDPSTKMSIARPYVDGAV